MINYSDKQIEGLFVEINSAIDGYAFSFNPRLNSIVSHNEKIMSEKNLVRAIENLSPDLRKEHVFTKQIEFLLNNCNHSKKRFANLVLAACEKDWIASEREKYAVRNYSFLNTEGNLTAAEELKLRQTDQPYFDHAIIVDLKTQMHTFYTRRKAA